MISIDDQRSFIRGELAKLGTALGLPRLESFADELESDAPLKAAIEAQVAGVEFFRTKHWDSILRLGLYRVVQYAIGRAVKPAGVVETGVLHGLSTAFPLAALARNGGPSRMISIDAPSTFEQGPSNQDGFHDTLPPKLGPGWAIPDTLRGRWQLKIGTSRQHLPATLSDLGTIGLFIHDSEHTVDTMLFEFEAAWPALADGGVLIADNIDVNTSFFDFARSKKRIAHVLPVDPDHAQPGASGIRCGLLLK